ncbi:methylated-DNA-protein-cysteine methyltransferase [Rothia aeria]|uniref:Methylated-DNA-protein-cysteine methyltransferase n=1 Tax=Rothia aeria TaxID=172042 RepID=A0A2Z5QYX4_9MICC|nr:methylated-DNA-protein-cysteine methyltransferase [Rothia aeria]
MGRLYMAASDNALTGIWYEEQAHFPLPMSWANVLPTPLV